MPRFSKSARPSLKKALLPEPSFWQGAAPGKVRVILDSHPVEAKILIKYPYVGG